MKILHLILQKKYFLEILSGSKKEEVRHFTDFYQDKLCDFDKKGEWIGMKEYNAIRFQLGYSKNPPQIIVELKDIILNIKEEVNEDDELNSENCHFSLILGDILEKKNCENL